MKRDKKKYNIKWLSVALSLTVLSYLGCILDLPYRALEKQMIIQSDTIELKQTINGNIGFCSIFDYSIKGDFPFSHPFTYIGMGYDNLNTIQKDFVDVISGKISTDTNCKQIQDFNYYKNGPKFSHWLQDRPFTTAHGYIMIFDEKDRNDVWVMNKESLSFFNKYFKCDYYLSGKINLYFVDGSVNSKDKDIQPNLFLVLYNNKGYKVWSKLYKKQYADKDKNQKLDDLYYTYINKLLSDYKEEINNDLSFTLK